jgi:hypothetical protein
MKKLTWILLTFLVIGTITGIGFAAKPTNTGNPADQFTAIWDAITGLQTKDTAQDEAISQIGVINGTVNGLLINATEQQTEINAIPGPLHIGDWQQKQSATGYTATTDGFVVGYASNAPSPNVIIELVMTPDGHSYKIYSTINPEDVVSFNLPVKAGDTWSVYQNSASSSEPLIDFTIYWVPLES